MLIGERPWPFRPGQSRRLSDLGAASRHHRCRPQLRQQYPPRRTRLCRGGGHARLPAGSHAQPPALGRDAEGRIRARLAAPRCRRDQTRRVKILEVTNVDFSLRHFLLPLMRGAAARGHEVVGVCADGPLLADVRAEGFRVEPLPLARSLSPVAQCRALARPDRRCSGPSGRTWCTRTCRSAASSPGWPRGSPACRRVAYTCHGFLFNQPGPLAAPGARPRDGMARRPAHRHLPDRLRRGGRGRAPPAHRAAAPSPSATAATRPRFHPDPAARAAHPRRARLRRRTRVVIVIVSRLVRHKGYPELLAAMREVPERRALGGRRAPAPPTTARTWTRYFAAAGLGAAAAPPRLPRPTSPPCSPRRTSSRCRAISRGCRCR